MFKDLFSLLYEDILEPAHVNEIFFFLLVQPYQMPQLLTTTKIRCFALKMTKLEYLQANEQVS